GCHVATSLLSLFRRARATRESSPGRVLGKSKEPIAIQESLYRVEHIEFRLPPLLYPFGLGKERAGCGSSAGLVQGIRRAGAFACSLKKIAALVGMYHRLACICYGTRQQA